MAAENDDPFGSFNFHVEIDGESGIKAYFNEVSGLKGDVEELEIKEGGVNDRTHKMPGRIMWGPVTLKRGIDNDRALFKWWSKIVGNEKGKVRKTVRIVMLDEDFSEVRSWTLKEAWPKSWEGPAFNSGGSEIAFESVTLNHHGVTES
jgi:phage tail-like protein